MVIYRVVVHQEGFFLSGDAHRTSIQLVGSKGASDCVPLAERSVKYEVSCPASLGALLLVRLEAPPTTTSVWFCSKVTVTTPEGRVLLFPCYRFVRCSTALSKITPWSCYDDSLPESMKAEDVTSLPAEVRFSVVKATDMILTVSELDRRVKAKGPTSAKHLWELLQDCWKIISGLVERLWKDDWFFGQQFLNGANPTLIRRCSELPSNMAVTEEMVRSSLEGGASLQQEMERGNIFLVDYRRLDGLTPNMVNKKQNYITAPLVLLHLNSKHFLLPIAIQLKQAPGEDNPVFVPQDLEFDWLTAKTFVRAADFAEHELHAHFLRTHMMSELFAMATLRNFPMAHPLYKLLIPHFRFTLEIDTLARNLLISDGGTLSTYTAVGGPGMLEFLRRASAALTYHDLCLPDDITRRGLESIPNYYYRDDGLQLWNIIHRYVEGVASYYYHDDSDVIRDSELQSWINEIIVFGHLIDEKKGFPKSFTSVSELTYFVTMVIFTASAQHAAVNNAQLDYFGWMPNAPVGLQLPPPSTKGLCSESSLLASFPDVNATVHGLATVYLLSKRPTDYVPLGSSAEQHFTENFPVEMAARFRSDLKRLSYEIQVRNIGLMLPYVYLQPHNVEDSVAR
uniref:Lipoxygenase domain-containing protein n=1 Tax=Myripristis murdjan TaxID=586833 RepID=A0A667XQV3_9TELE